jgi:type IV secretion system protein VirD4
LTNTQQESDDWLHIAVKNEARDSLGARRVRIGRTSSRIYAAEEFRPVLVLGPQRSYKTSGFAVPTILEWDGPAVITSVRHDVLDDTYKWRQRIGKINVFDPSGSLRDTQYASKCRNWNLLAHCRTWDDCVRMGQALTEAGRGRSGPQGGAGGGLQDGGFWYSLAGKLIVPHLFAASQNGYTMRDVIRWIQMQEEFEVRSLLQATGHQGAIRAADATWQREERSRSSIYTTAEQVLQVYDYEDNDIFSEPFLDFDTFFSSKSDSLYICAPPDEQEEYRPLFTGLVRTIIREVYRRNSQILDNSQGIIPDDTASVNPSARKASRIRFSRSSVTDTSLSVPDTSYSNPNNSYSKTFPMLLMLDEAGNIASLANLDTLATTAAGTQLQLVTIFHDLSQMEALYGIYAAQSIIANHSALIVLPGARDVATLDYIESLLRGENVANSIESKWVGPRPIRSMKRGEALLIYENLRPIVLSLRSKFTDKFIRARVEGEQLV